GTTTVRCTATDASGNTNGCAFTIAVNATIRTSTWDGGGANSFWSNPTNWMGDVAPQNGDVLVFPNGAARLNNTNDLVGLTVATIHFLVTGYTLSGNGVTVASNIIANDQTGLNKLNFSISFSGGQSISINGSGVLAFTGPISIGGTLI